MNQGRGSEEGGGYVRTQEKKGKTEREEYIVWYINDKKGRGNRGGRETTLNKRLLRLDDKRDKVMKIPGNEVCGEEG